MRSKLFKILLSVFMITVTFTTNIFADESKTIADILPEDFPKISSNAWPNEDGAYLNIEDDPGYDVLSFYLTNDIRVDVPTANVVDDSNEYTDGTITVKFNINNSVLESVVLSGHSSDELNGTYVKPYSIADVLAKSKEPFPTTIDKAWKNDDGVGIYKDLYTGHSESYEVLYITFDGVDGIPFSGTVSDSLIGKDDNPYIDFGDGKVVFKIENDVLVKIEIIELDDSINGVYKPQDITPTPSPTPEPDSIPEYTIPNTGVDGTYSNNHLLLKLSSLSTLVIGSYLIVKKKR